MRVLIGKGNMFIEKKSVDESKNVERFTEKVY